MKCRISIQFKMIKERNLEKGYIWGKSQEIKADPLLVERTIFAFELLSQLVKVRIPLVFKGGTSLLILMPKLRLISIDIDIVTSNFIMTLRLKVVRGMYL